MATSGITPRWGLHQFKSQAKIVGGLGTWLGWVVYGKRNSHVIHFWNRMSCECIVHFCLAKISAYHFKDIHENYKELSQCRETNYSNQIQNVVQGWYYIQHCIDWSQNTNQDMISNHMLSRVWNEITYSQASMPEPLTFRILHFMMDVITYPCWLKLAYVSKSPPPPSPCLSLTVE